MLSLKNPLSSVTTVRRSLTARALKSDGGADDGVAVHIGHSADEGYCACLFPAWTGTKRRIGIRSGGSWRICPQELRAFFGSRSLGEQT